jgi:hypothetical protein
VELFPGFQDDFWFSTGHFADVMMGFGHDAEASSCHAFYCAQCSFVYRMEINFLTRYYHVIKHVFFSVEFMFNLIHYR